MNGGATGTSRRAQEERQQGQDLVEAQAHGQGRRGEFLLLGRWELDGLEQPVPELGVLVAEEIVLLNQFLSSRSATVLGFNGGQNLLGMIVDALAATAGLLGLFESVEMIAFVAWIAVAAHPHEYESG